MFATTYIFSLSILQCCQSIRTQSIGSWNNPNRLGVEIIPIDSIDWIWSIGFFISIGFFRVDQKLPTKSKSRQFLQNKYEFWSKLVRKKPIEIKKPNRFPIELKFSIESVGQSIANRKHWLSDSGESTVSEILRFSCHKTQNESQTQRRADLLQSAAMSP